MSLTVAYGALLTGVVVWFLLVRRLTAKSWETRPAAPDGTVGENVDGASGVAPARVGLWVFLAVITSLFGLFISAYYMRMGHGHGADHALHDWTQLTEPTVLWLNTAILFLSSVAMQWSRSSAARADAEKMQTGLMIGGLLTITFLAGQFYAWRELRMTEFFSPRNPAIAFFYVLTAVHGLHLLGGLYVWGRTLVRMREKGREVIDLRLSVELCTVYWHYLLLVWLVLFALLLST